MLTASSFVALKFPFALSSGGQSNMSMAPAGTEMWTIKFTALVFTLCGFAGSSDYADRICRSGVAWVNLTAEDGAVLSVFLSCGGSSVAIDACTLEDSGGRLIDSGKKGVVATKDGKFYILSCNQFSEPRIYAGIAVLCQDEMRTAFGEGRKYQRVFSESDKRTSKAVTVDVVLDANNNVTVLYNVSCKINPPRVDTCTVPSGRNSMSSVVMTTLSTETISAGGLYWDITCNKYGPATSAPRFQDYVSATFCVEAHKAAFEKGDVSGSGDSATAEATTRLQLDKDNYVTVVYHVACFADKPRVEKCVFPSGSRHKSSVEIKPKSTDTIVDKAGVDWDITCKRQGPAEAVKSSQDYAAEVCAADVASAWRTSTDQSIYPTPNEVKATKQVSVDVQVSDTDVKLPVVLTVTCLDRPKPTLQSCTYVKGSRIRNNVTLSTGELAYIGDSNQEYELKCSVARGPIILKKRVTEVDGLCEDDIKKAEERKNSGKPPPAADDVIAKTVQVSRPNASATKLKSRIKLTLACFGNYPKIKTCQHLWKLKNDLKKPIEAGNYGPCVDVGILGKVKTKLDCKAVHLPVYLDPTSTAC